MPSVNLLYDLYDHHFSMTNHQKMQTTKQFNHHQIKLKNNQPNQFKNHQIE